MTIKLLLKTKPCKSFTIVEQPISITPAKSVTLSKKARLALLVNQHIAEDPYEFEDFQWAAIVQPDLASLPKEGILCVGVGQLTNIELDAIEKGERRQTRRAVPRPLPTLNSVRLRCFSQNIVPNAGLGMAR